MASRDGRWLVAKRNPGGSQGGKWEFPGGKGEEGETAEQALEREFLEELAVKIKVDQRLYTGQFSNRGKDYILEAWAITLLSDRLIPLEHSEVGWFLPAEVLALDLSDSDRQVAEALLNASK